MEPATERRTPAAVRGFLDHRYERDEHAPCRELERLRGDPHISADGACDDAPRQGHVRWGEAARAPDR